MYTYEDGDLAFTREPERAHTLHALSMAASGSYPLAPDTVGALHELLGPAPLGVGRIEAKTRVLRVLRRLGLETAVVEDVVEHLGRDWKLVLKVSDT